MPDERDPTQNVEGSHVSKESESVDDVAGDSIAESMAADTYKVPEFSPLHETPPGQIPGGLDRFYDVHVPIWAELGRVEMLLGDLMQLDEGSVLRLDRPVGEPVDIVSQGVKLASGEVVVIDDCFAVRIKEIEKSSKAFK